MTQQAHLNTACAAIVEIEQRCDRLLHEQAANKRFVRTLQEAQRDWSDAIWAAAEASAALVTDAGELERSLRLAQRPVFICGAARSGTTMLRDLLDGHPQLVVIPHESGFYRDIERGLAGLGSHRHCDYLARRWIERLAARPPFWLLGRSTTTGSPYVAFVRDFAGWWQVPERHKEARTSSWPLAAFALAFAQQLGGGRLPPRAERWVEKTPGSERSLARIWQDFPAAKVIQIVRRPEAVLLSAKNLRQRPWTGRRRLSHIFGEMAPSYRIAARCRESLPEDRYCLVRYEDLTADPEAVMARIAAFLEIEASPLLLQPTVAGRTAVNNTSFASSRPELRQSLDSVDCMLLAMAVARPAAKLGYTSAEPPSTAVTSIVGNPA